MLEKWFHLSRNIYPSWIRNSERYLDNVCGVYKKGNILMIGNSPIEFEGNIVDVCDTTF